MRKLIFFELRKIMAKRLTWAMLLVAVLLTVLLHVSTYQNKFAFDGQRQETGKEAVALDQEIAAGYEGELTDEKVRQMLSELMPQSGPQGLNVIYIYQNAMQSAVAARFSDMEGNWNGLSVSDVFGQEKIKIGYVDGWLGAIQDMTKVFLCLSVVVIVMLTPVFGGEYGGVEKLILSGRYGRTKCAAAKAIAGLLAAFGTTAAIVILNVALAFVMYGKSGLDCSILFAPLSFTEGYIPFNITCATLLKYRILLAFMGIMGAAGITLILSALCRNQMTALPAALAVYVLPALLPFAETSSFFKILALSPLYQLLFVALMSVRQFAGGLLYAIWALPIAILLTAAGGIISGKIFAGHQVSA